jgi:Flp pilus assembly pilin Flp
MLFVLLLLLQRVPASLPSIIRIRRRCRPDQRGQATAEYALVLLGAAAVAVTLVNWAGGGHLAKFFDAIMNRLMSAAK